MKEEFVNGDIAFEQGLGFLNDQAFDLQRKEDRVEINDPGGRDRNKDKDKESDFFEPAHLQALYRKPKNGSRFAGVVF
jgi:hypothetical protein